LWVSGVRCEVSGARRGVSGARCEVSGEAVQVLREGECKVKRIEKLLILLREFWCVKKPDLSLRRSWFVEMISIRKGRKKP